MQKSLAQQIMEKLAAKGQVEAHPAGFRRVEATHGERIARGTVGHLVDADAVSYSYRTPLRKLAAGDPTITGGEIHLA